MTVDAIRELISEYRFKNTFGLDALSVDIVNAYKRGKVTEVEQLLSYIKAVCVSSSQSAHILFLGFMRQSDVSLDGLAARGFSLDSRYDVYTKQISELHRMYESEEGNKLLTQLNLNVYTKMFHISDDVYCTRDTLRLYRLKTNEVNFLRLTFGPEYLIDIRYPDDMSCYDLVYLFCNSSKLEFTSGDNLASIVRCRKDYKPLTDKRIVDYSIGNMSNGLLINLVVCKNVQLTTADIQQAIRELTGNSKETYALQQLDKYRLVIFVNKET